MTAISEYLGMGGYAGYVWSAYGVSAVVMLAMLVASLRMLRGNQAAHDALDVAGAERNKGRANEKKT